MKPFAICGLLGLLILASQGCKSKEDIALEKVRARVPPGFVRVINLGSTEIKTFDGNRQLNTVKAGAFSKPTTLGAGDRVITVKGGKEAEAKVNFKVTTKMVYTVIAWPDGTITGLSEGLPRLPEDVNNGFVVFADPSGTKTSGTASIITPGGNKMEVSAAKTLTLTPGIYKSADGKAEVKVESQFSYGLMFLEQNGKVYPVFAINSDDVKAAISGMASS